MDLREITKNVNHHPWELSRGECVFSILKKIKLHSLADIGAGDKFFTKKLLKICSGEIYAIDSGYTEDEKEEAGIICLNNITSLPENSVECLIMMDILEHIENDEKFLGEVLKKLMDGGILLITVPAWQLLFSEHDKFLKHYRRYNKKGLSTLLKQSNIIIKRIHYFYTSLFFVRLFIKIMKKEQKGKNTIGYWKYSEKNIITMAIKITLNIDFYINTILSKIGIHLPGLSIIAVCKKEVNKLKNEWR
jgi:hypothetical protein